MPDNDAPKKPTIDERLEALAQTVELMQRDYEHRSAQTLATFDKIAQALEQDAENIRTLARIAEAHQHRIEHLEGEQ